jgi:hypothetical protein
MSVPSRSKESAMTRSAIGTHAWTVRTGGHLSPKERRSLLPPLARTHAVNVAGRLAMLAHLSPGRHATIDPSRLAPPATPLARAAEVHAQRRLTPALLGHSHRTYAFGAALAELDGVDVDRELLFVAAMLHDVGLTGPRTRVDFTLASARAARDVAEEVGLSSAATEVVRTAITLHPTPGVTLEDGPVAYLLSAGAAVDVAGVHSWKLPPRLLRDVVATRPRLGLKREFAALWRAEAQAVPDGRAQLLRRYGGIALAIRLAPFAE